MRDLNSLQITEDMHSKGYSIVPGFLTHDECDHLKTGYDDDSLYRKTVVMERYRFGLGEYKYFNYPLPELINTVREHLYPTLSVIANAWMNALNINTAFPKTLHELQALCHANGQLKATPLILKYGKGGFNTLHQDLYGEIYFPIQAVFILSKPGSDFTGGEFVLTQQTPRAQSKAMVLTPGKGDLILFTTNFRPVKGSKGYYRATMKHGVSEVTSGQRYSLGIIFHDAVS